MTNVKSLLEMYVKMGGSLTDTYADIAGGVPVGQYSTISDAILACSKKYSAGGGGGAEKFVVTLTQDAQTEEWTADKTIAEIVEAYDAGQIVVALYPVSGSVFAEIPCNVAAVVSSRSVAVFCGNYALESSAYNVASITASNAGGDDAWYVGVIENPVGVPSYSSSNNGQVLGVSSSSLAWVDSNAPLIVTLTADQSTGNFVGDKTYKEVYDAFMAGQNCILSIPSAFSAVSVLSVGHESGYSIIASNEISATGSADDYITVTVGG